MGNDFVKGGSFLITDFSPEEIFTPEDISDEHRMIAKTTADFLEGEVVPKIDQIEQQQEGLMKELLQKAGALGLLGAEVPEEYGGSGLDKITSAVIAENVVRAGAFGVAFMAHTGIGTLPIVYFGTEEQKKKYLPGLASGEKVAAYALTEPGAGSDALNAKTKAVLSEDGKYYILNGTKQFITNAGMADIFITYAKVDGEKFTAFIVDANTPGVSTGAEEKKMGIKGSSTRTVNFDDVKVPVENVLYEIGKGHVVAFNVLNIGRFKLAAGAVGSTRLALETSIKYANERTQFNMPISKFGLIKEKIAEMAIKIYAAESAAYRTAGMIDQAMELLFAQDKTGKNTAKAIEEYALECSINKVLGSEVLDYVVDEAVQIHGGYGYTQEYPVERMYRDSRINRIFEGTNEINRLIIPATLLKKAEKGELPLLAAVKKIMADILTPLSNDNASSVLSAQEDIVKKSKKLILILAASAVQKYGNKIQFEQEILGNIADMIINVFAMESALLRTQKAIAKDGEEKSAIKIDMTQVYINDTIQRIDQIAKETLSAIEEGDNLRTQLSILKKLTRFSPINTIAARRRIAEKLIAKEKYILQA